MTLKKELNKLLSQIENAKHEKKNLEMEINKYKIIINNENVMKLYEELFANICKDLYLSNDNIKIIEEDTSLWNDNTKRFDKCKIRIPENICYYKNLYYNNTVFVNSFVF